MESHANGCAVTGGYVYRGTNIPSLRGKYVLGDWCRPEINWMEEQDGKMVAKGTLLTKSGIAPTAFGQDKDGELYNVNGTGGVYRIDPI